MNETVFDVRTKVKTVKYAYLCEEIWSLARYKYTPTQPRFGFYLLSIPVSIRRAV